MIKTADEWNAKYPPGTKFRTKEMTWTFPPREVETRSAAFMSGDKPMIRATTGEFIDLTRVDVVLTDAG